MKKFEGMLLACDMDGTLLDSNHSISYENEQAMQYFAREGGRFSLATGRAPGAIKTYLPQIPFNAPYSLLNGSMIFDAHHHVIHSAGMPKSSIDLIGSLLSKFSQIGCEIFVGEQILVCQMSDVTEHHLRVLDLNYSTVTQEKLSNTESWCKINLTGEPELIQSVQAFLKPYSKAFCITSSMPSFCEITAAGVSKGSALRQIAKKCGIQQSNTFSIGDSYNDESMIMTAHVSFAPANADEDILQKADIVVGSNDESAVSQAIAYIESHYCSSNG
nr:Cof-type HAD-IIB family hydrolase [uncultured Agathobaculum sp.]